MKNENELKFSYLIFKIVRKINWHLGTRIHIPTENHCINLFFFRILSDGRWHAVSFIIIIT